MSGQSTSSPVVSRRSFLAGVSAGSLILMAKVSGQQVSVADAATTDAELFNPDLLVSIAPDGQVIITAHRSEMGTGIRTGLPRAARVPETDTYSLRMVARTMCRLSISIVR